ncbi:MAG TPA: M20 aminoacylase family protein [Defluviicoccus sp.]|nr:M20 aminoacylase family protein [Defluviicoccus sp.]
MPVEDGIAALKPDMTDWRRYLHAHAETAFQERETAAFVAARLREFGIEVHEGLAGTGVVGTLRNGDGPAIGLRADLDGLPIAEETGLPYASKHAGRMHACGHDGHTAMLLGAARHLAQTRRFAGTVQFIFQPAEENEGGARVMIEQGLFERFPVRQVFGMHNWPAMPAGHFAVRAGPLMAACDTFEITVSGTGCHGAMPHFGFDAIVAAAALVSTLQTIVSRAVDPLEAAVVSVTQIHAGDTWNVLPARAVLKGTIRTFQPAVRERIESALTRIAEGTAAAHGCRAEVHYLRHYPATVNAAAETELAAAVAEHIVGAARVIRNPPPTTGSEDFAFMLQVTPGCYIWIGSGRGREDPSLHSPHYDFNDDILPVGASYWVKLVETGLA